MLNTRNIRVAAAALMLFVVVGYFAFSADSFSDSAQRMKVPVSSEQAISNAGAKQPPIGADKNKTPYEPSLNNANAEIPPSDAKTSEEDENRDPAKVLGGEFGKVDSANGFSADKSKAGVASKDAANTISKPKEVANSKLAGTCDKQDYVIMIDAGSTGSRIHVYKFDTCVSPPALLHEEFKMLNPGLSSFDTDTKGAAASLDPLLAVALETVPKNKQLCTPVAVMATAGLRLLGQEKSDAILKEVRRHLEVDYPFAVVDGDGVSIMDGKDEGVYAWITANYLLGNIGSAEKIPTAAVFDLGGGSTQIVFEPEMGDNEKMVEGEHKYELSFGNRQFTLYQFSHLGYGLMQGRNKVNALVLSSALKGGLEVTNLESKAGAKDAEASVTVVNPCMAPGVTAKNVGVEVSNSEYYVVNFKGPADASGAQCRHLAEKVLNMEVECKSKPCSFNGIYQPSLVKAFHRNSDMWVFSYFYDRTNPLGFPNSFTVEELRDLTKTVCSGSNLWKDALLGDSVKQLQEEPHWCLDLSFITAMLHTGYNIPLLRELRTAKTIANNELGWCLGASLRLLNPEEGGWKCRVDQVA